MIEVIIPLVIGFSVLIGLMVYFIIIPTYQKSKTEIKNIAKNTAESAEEAAAKAANASKTAENATSAAVAETASNTAKIASDVAQKTADALEQQVVNAKNLLEAATNAVKSAPENQVALTNQTKALTELSLIEAEAVKARAAAELASSEAARAAIIANEKAEAELAEINQQITQTKEQADRAAAEAAATIAAEQAQPVDEDPTTPAPPTTQTAVSEPASIVEENTKFCKDNWVKGYNYFNANPKGFFPELKQQQSYSNKIRSSGLFLNRDNVSYNPVTNECTYNIKPFHYVQLVVNKRPEPIYLPNSTKGIKIDAVENL